MSILPILSRPKALEYLRPVTFTVADRNEFTVHNKHHVMDGNENTYADAAFWGAGQGLTLTLPDTVRIGAVEMVAEVYEGPEWSNCAAHFGGETLSVNLGEGKARRSWTGDVSANVIDVIEYARTRIYEVKVWEIVPFEAKQPVIVEPTPIQAATTQAVAKVGAGLAEYNATQADLVTSQDIGAVQAYVNEQATYWADMAVLDPDNVNTIGTLGYLAASAADFWEEAKTAFGNPPELLQQTAYWRDYSTAQAGKDFADMQPIDIWFEAR